MTDEEIRAGAKAIAADMVLPGGSAAKLAKVIGRHLPWFEAARQRGMTWDDITGLLFEAGARRQEGLPLSRGHLSSLVWRKSRADADKRSDAKPNQAIREEMSAPAVRELNNDGVKSEGAPSISSRRAHRGKPDMRRFPSSALAKGGEAVRAPRGQTETQPTSTRRTVDNSGLTGDDKAALRELLQRAAAARSQKGA